MVEETKADRASAYQASAPAAAAPDQTVTAPLNAGANTVNLSDNLSPKTGLRSADLVAMKLKDPEVAAAVAGNSAKLDELTAAAKNTADASPIASAIRNDGDVYRMAVKFIGWGAMAAIAGIIGLSLANLIVGSMNPQAKAIIIPDALVSFAATAVGALAGLLNPLQPRTSN